MDRSGKTCSLAFKTRIYTCILGLVLFFLPILPVNAQERSPLILLTSFPDALYQPFKTAFEKNNPDIELFVLNKKTSAAISYIQDRQNHQVDLFWASAPDAFEVLKQSNDLEKLKTPGVARNARNARIGGYPLNDPDGYYLGFAVSGYGIMWNTAYLKRHDLPEPESWNDLRKGIYENHLGLSAPSRSGTTHLIVEIILQSKGWDEGWRTLLEIGGNLATVTARSYGVRNGVEEGRFGAGLVIDFFGLMSKASGHPVKFVYPEQTVMLPANIAMVKGAKNPGEAARFIAFVMSDEGQKFLFQPAISRLPVRPEIYEFAPSGFPNPFKGVSRRDTLLFDSRLSRLRYHLVNALFDQLVTYRLRELKDAWSLIHRAGKKLSRSNLPGMKKSLDKALDKARDLVFKIPVDERLSRNARVNAMFTRHKPGFAVAAGQLEFEAKWRKGALARYARAAQIAESVLMRLEAGADGQGIK